MSVVSPILRREVEQRAGGRCEFCRIRQEDEPFFRFHVDHIVARQHGGETTADNLALACHFCNRHKGPNLSSIDPETGETVALFHPRTGVWDDHFRLSGERIEGVSAVGRASVRLLRMNASNRVVLRRAEES